MTGRRYGGRLLLAAWLVLVWTFVWGSAGPGVLLSGLAVAGVVVVAARVAPQPVRVRPRWRRLPGVLWRFVLDLVESSARVAWAAVRRDPPVRSAIVAIPMPEVSDAVLTAACNRVSLVPGTIVINLDRAAAVIHFYVMDVAGPDRTEAVRGELRAAVDDVVQLLDPYRCTRGTAMGGSQP